MSLEVNIRRAWKGFSLMAGFAIQGETLAILGASGSGKSMTLKCIAGIETPDAGRIAVGGRVLFDSERKINLRPQQRRVGYLFQSYALFPHMTVEDNIGCALGAGRGARRGNGDILRRFQLEGLEKRYPAQLSGGQQQRVALARILVQEPEVLLLDEPFSALDAYLKEQLQVALLDLLRAYAGEVVLVTHSRDEAYRLSGRLLVLENGRPVAEGNTKEMFDNPRYLSVAKLTGCKNFSRARVVDGDTVEALDWGVRLRVRGPVEPGVDMVGVRAHSFMPADAGQEPVNRFPIRVLERIENPFEWNVVFAVDNGAQSEKIWWKFSKEHSGTELPAFLSVSPEQVLLLTADA